MSGEESITKAEVDQAVDVLDQPTPTVTEPDPDAWLTEHGLEAVSDDDLRGIEEEEEEEEAEEESEETPEEGDENDSEEEEEETETPPPEESKKPPKGFVPTKAIQEVRQENRYLKDQIKALEEKIEAVAKRPAEKAEPEEEFKVLSKEELLELYEDDPREALAYTVELQEHKEKQAAKEKEAQLQQYETAQAQQVFKETADLMEKAVPGIFDDESDTQEKLVEFAESMGFSENLFFLTNPETKVILPGESKPTYLGKQAAEVLGFIAGLQEKLNSPDRTKMETELRKTIEAEVLQKLKSSPGKDFKSLADIPTSETEKPRKFDRVLSETEFAKLSAQEQEAYLTGE